MDYAKQSNRSFLRVTINTNEQERKEIDRYFNMNPALKKGETIKRWILEAIQEEAHERVTA